MNAPTPLNVGFLDQLRAASPMIKRASRYWRRGEPVWRVVELMNSPAWTLDSLYGLIEVLNAHAAVCPPGWAFPARPFGFFNDYALTLAWIDANADFNDLPGAKVALERRYNRDFRHDVRAHQRGGR